MDALNGFSYDVGYLSTSEVSGFEAVAFFGSKYAERRRIDIGPVDTELSKDDLQRIPDGA
jgi:hypothetical protein